MSELRDIEDAFDAFLDQADKVMGMTWNGSGGNVADEIIRLARMLSRIPLDLRVLCDLDDYYRVVVDYTLGTGYGSEVA